MLEMPKAIHIERAIGILQAVRAGIQGEIGDLIEDVIGSIQALLTDREADKKAIQYFSCKNADLLEEIKKLRGAQPACSMADTLPTEEPVAS